MRRYFVGYLTPSNEPDEPDAQGKESRTYAIFGATSGVGFVYPLHNPTRCLTRKMVRRRVGEEHSRVSS